MSEHDPAAFGRGNPREEQPDGGEWFAHGDPATGERGLRFSCTMCGNCCSGPEGYVLVSERECAALAARLGLEVAEFVDRYTHVTAHGRSLNEKITPSGHDCVFLDRERVPGKAVCGVYKDRPTQCRTWPFWPSVLRDRHTWERSKRICPGIGKGTLIPVSEVRVRRDTFRI